MAGCTARLRVFEADQHRQQLAVEVAPGLRDGMRMHAEMRLVQGQKGRNAIERIVYRAADKTTIAIKRNIRGSARYPGGSRREQPADNQLRGQWH